MAYNVSTTQYRREWIVLYQRAISYLKDSTIKESIMSGDSVKWPLQGIAPPMTDRGNNSMIPPVNRPDTAITAFLKERHLLETHTKFEVFTSQANLRMAMRNAGMKSVNREIDAEIIGELANGTQSYSQNALDGIKYGALNGMIANLAAKDVNDDEELCALWTPMAWAWLMLIRQITSNDYVPGKPLANKQNRPFYWLGCKHIRHTGLPGMGTANATCFIFAKSAIGHAVAMNADDDVDVGYDGQHAYYWTRHSIYHVAKILQDSGILKIPHNDTAALPDDVINLTKAA